MGKVLLLGSALKCKWKQGWKQNRVDYVAAGCSSQNFHYIKWYLIQICKTIQLTYNGPDLAFPSGADFNKRVLVCFVFFPEIRNWDQAACTLQSDLQKQTEWELFSKITPSCPG